MERWAKARSQTAAEAKELWAIRLMLDQEHRLRDRALFHLAIDSNFAGAISSEFASVTS